MPGRAPAPSPSEVGVADDEDLERLAAGISDPMRHVSAHVETLARGERDLLLPVLAPVVGDMIKALEEQGEEK